MSVMQEHRVQVILTEMNCGLCGGTYAINERYRAQKAQEGGGWHCPYCQGSWGYFGDHNENARLKRELAAQKKRTEWAEQATKQAQQRADSWKLRERAQRAAKTRIKKRVAAGVCPCCTRSFANLARHMKGQHPDYAADLVEQEADRGT